MGEILEAFSINNIVPILGQIFIALMLTLFLLVGLYLLAAILLDMGYLKASILLSRMFNALTNSGYILIGIGYYYRGEFSIAADYFLTVAQKDLNYRPLAIYYLARCTSCLENVYEWAVELILPEEFKGIEDEFKANSEYKVTKYDLNIYSQILNDKLSQARVHMALAITFYFLTEQVNKSIELANSAVEYADNIEPVRRIPIYNDYIQLLLLIDQPEKALNILDKTSTVVDNSSFVEKIRIGMAEISYFHFLKAKTLYRIDNKEEALKYFKKAIESCKESFYADQANSYLNKLELLKPING